MKLTAALIGSFLATSYALACSCMAPPPPAQAMEKAAAVFSGKVTAIKAEGHGKSVMIKVDQSWKGVETETVTVHTSSDSASCGFAFKEGTDYLVYAFAKDENDKGLSTNLCTRTKSLASAKEDLDALGEGKKVESKK
jgi:hypothetical protein